MNRLQLTTLLFKNIRKHSPELLDERDALADVVCHLIEKTLTERQIRDLFAFKGEGMGYLKPSPAISSMIEEAFVDGSAESGVVFEEVFGDWKAHAGDKGEDVSREKYKVKVTSKHNTGTLYVDLESVDSPGFGASIGIDIAEGLPVVRCSNVIDGDNVLSVHFSKTEVAVCPDSRNDRLHPTDSKAYFSHLPSLRNMLALDSDAIMECD